MDILNEKEKKRNHHSKNERVIRMENDYITKSGRKKYISAISVLFILISSFLIGCQTVFAASEIGSFNATPTTADVGESVIFYWFITGGYKESYLNFGDGTTKEVTGLLSVSHEYNIEGSFQAMLLVVDYTDNIVNQTLNIIIKNNAPDFNISFSNANNIAGEDEAVNISVVDLVESTIDQTPGKLTYIYDFADGIENQISTNLSMVSHSWNNSGVYPVTITIIDDQNAIRQYSKDITIVNIPPQGRINIGVDDDYDLTQTEYIASFNWRPYEIGSVPDLWDLSYVNPHQWIDTATTNASIDVVSDIHYKVLKLLDSSDNNSITMENDFSNQSHGSVEFWVQSSDVSSKTWALSLWDNNDLAFRVLMNNNEWQYTTCNSYKTITPFYSGTSIDAPINDEWYHVRIDFCIDNSTSNYYGLNASQFRITINDIQSNIYTIDNLDVLHINKILLQSGISDTGVSLIDAIGYSWTPTYLIGDNRWPVLNYPDKSVFLLSAADSIDTASDMDSLRYYWQYGDGTTGYGKHVHHQYTKSGLYRINMTVKDDNGDIGSTARFISVNNLVPEINFTLPNDDIIIHEGETAAFNIDIVDDLTDLTTLEYWWNYEFTDAGIDVNNLTNFESGGWKGTHAYSDDFNGDVYVVAKDREETYGYNSIGVEVLNVAPSLSVWDASIMANSTLFITRSDEDVILTYDILLCGNDAPEVQYYLESDDSDTNILNTGKELIDMSLSKSWKLVVNASNIPNMTWIKYDFLLEFDIGEELVISSDKLYPGSEGYWEVDLNPYFYDTSNYNFNYPITFSTQLWDPSDDDLSLTMNYNAYSLVELDCAPDTGNFIYNIGGINYIIDVFPQAGDAMANISFTTLVESEFYDNNEFPVNLDLDCSIKPLFDLEAILDELEPDLAQGPLSVVSCLDSSHYFSSHVTDDDGGTASLTVSFNTTESIKFDNLSIGLVTAIPDEAAEIRDIRIFGNVFDFNRVYKLQNQIIEFYNSSDPSSQSLYDIEYLLESDKIPHDTHFFIESNYGSFYIVDSVNKSSFLKSDDNGLNWSNVILPLEEDFKIVSLWYDRQNEYIYIASSNTTTIDIIQFRVSDDSINNQYLLTVNNSVFSDIDIILENNILYVRTGIINNGYALMHFESIDISTLSSTGSFFNNMSLINGRTFNMSYCVFDGYFIYYLWQWSNNGIEMWKFDIFTSSFEKLNVPELYDTMLLDDPQTSITYDGFETIGFVLNDTETIEIGQYPGTYDFNYEMEQGNYKGTYSFENDMVGGDPNDFTIDESGGTVNVVSEIGEHKNILELTDISATDAVIAKQTFGTNQSYGTVEWWMRINNTDPPDFLYAGIKNGNDRLAQVCIGNDEIWYLTNIYPYWHHTGIRGEMNTWFHFRIDFECTTGNYMGLSQYYYNLYINGTLNGVYGFFSVEDEAESFQAETDAGPMNFIGYIDAIGYSWDNWSYDGLGYEIGQGLNPDDLESLFNDNFTVDIPISSYIRTISELDGHHAVLEMCDHNNTYRTIISRDLNESQSYGTIEWWWRTTNAALTSDFHFRNGTHDILGFRVSSNGMLYWDGSWSSSIMSSSDNTWYHVRIDFECTNGGYNGLSQNKWRVYVQGSLYGDYDMAYLNSPVTQIIFRTGSTANGYYQYIDALGFSWDSNYTIGDNLYKIPAKLNEPGHYHGTYSFETENDGTEPVGWDPSPYDGSSFIEVDNTKDGHHKVLQVRKNGGSIYCGATKMFETNITAGSIEFWLYKDTNGGTDATKLDLKGVGGQLRFLIENQDLYHGHYGERVLIASDVFMINTWHHIRIDFDILMGGWQVQLDDILYGSAYAIPFVDTPTEFYAFGIGSHWSGCHPNYAAWIDAIGCSWDPYYNIGDNLIDLFDKHYYYTYNIESNVLNKGLLCDAVVMLDRNTVPGLYEKCFAISDNKIYQIGADGLIGLVAELNSTSPIIAISDNYIITEDKSVYQISYRFFEGTCSIIYNDGSGNAQIQQNLLLAWYLSTPFSTIFEGNVDFILEGDYLIRFIADNGVTQTFSGGLVRTEAVAPFCSIGTLPNITIEDQQLKLNSDIVVFGSEDTNSSNYRFEWNFGDGTYSYERNPIHSWSTSGTYNITLFVVDCYGKMYMDYKTIVIEEQPPEIRGPLTFQGVEGHAIYLNIEIYDSFIDEQFLTYTWYDEYDVEIIGFRNNKKPTLVLTDGFYHYKLRVEDQDGNFAMANITVIVDDLPPMVLASNYLYSGSSGGTIELQAYVYDNVNDLGNYEYEWMLTYGNVTTVHYGGKTGRTNIYSFSNDINMRICTGQVTATDTLTGKNSVTSFTITNYLDSNLNGVPDDYEWMVEEIGMVYILGWDYVDTDGDGLIDAYEEDIYTYNSSITNPDSDGDGLWDGYDPYSGIGERTVGTNPVKNDTDDDGLLDPTEFFGWNITSELFGTLHVTSDPLDVDTDDDGLFDGDEFNAGSNPRNPDTDSDGLTDGNDPFPTKSDGDGDGLSDYREYELGTAMDNSDTDGDGLSDGEEVLGWGFYTNPLDADCDHDFLADSAETQNTRFELGERRELNEPISLWFDEYCSKAASAQISIMIAFGEASGANDYGIIDVPNLNVIITKADDKLELLNENTNKTRYYSKSIDIREAIETHSLDYRGEYVVSINDTSAGCLLEQFEIGVVKFLNPHDDDFDNDGIMDGVETGLLVKGWDTIDINNTEDSLRGYYSGSHDFNYEMEQGKYYGTYDFSNETVGITGTNISIVDDIGVDYTTEIISSHEGHVNVLEVYRSGTFGDYPYDLITSPASGTVELWMDGSANIELQGSSNRLIVIGYDGVSNLVRIYHDTTYTDVPSIDGWAHVRIDFNCTTDQQSVWINGVNAVSGADFYESNTASYIDKVCFPVPNTITGYYDAIGYSWDNISHGEIGYEVGYNMNPYDIAPLLRDGFSFPNPVLNTEYSIKDEINGHSGVLDLYDETTSEKFNIYHDLGGIPKEYGTYEFWVSSNDVSDIIYIDFRADGSLAGRIRIGAEQISYFTGSYIDISPASDNTWYHVRIDFECGLGNYQGLLEDSYNIYINGVKFGPFSFYNSKTYIDDLRFSSNDGNSNYHYYLDSLGYSWDPYYNISDNMRDYLGEFDDYSLEIPYVGRVYDANVNLEISSNVATIGKGNVTIQLVKENMNNNILDVVLLNIFDTFDKEVFIYETVIDLSSSIGSGVIPEYYGTYRLRIKVNSTFAPEIIYVNEFTIDTDTFIQAGPTDTEAWITDPSKWDTDGDGWSDHYEIYDRSEPTNPLSVDTDGDGVWDRFDMDPLRDLIIEINPIYGAHRNLAFWETSPYLEITASLKSGGSDYFFCTPSSLATAEKVHRMSILEAYWSSTHVWFFGWHKVPILLFRWKPLYHCRKAYFNGAHGSYDSRYYANIDDNILTQSPFININFNLWQMGGLWDNHLISAGGWYWIGSHGWQQTFTFHQRPFLGAYNSMQVDVRTIGLEKANTIAIHDNTTVFNGHYQQKERMNVIQLFVKDSTKNLKGTPFVLGSNSIVIPTSLFTETLLNKYIQDERLEETVIYAEDNSKFISIERDGETEAACDDIDFIYVRYDISAKDAMEVLNILITILVNDTTGAMVVGYEYSSTKEDGFDAVLMNLPGAVLGFVPWECNYQNSLQGRAPRDFLQWLVQTVVSFVTFVVNIFVAIGQAFADIFAQIVEFVAEVLLAVIAIVAYLLWCLVRAALLIYVWISFGIALLFVTMAIAALALAFIPLSLIFGGSMYYTINSVGINISGLSFGTGFDTEIGNYDTFDIPVPYLHVWFSLGGTKMVQVTLKFWPQDFGFKFGDDISQEKQISSSLEDYNSEANDFIVESLNRKISDQSIGLTDSKEASRSIDISRLFSLETISKIFSGVETSLRWWTIAVPLGTIAIVMPSEISICAIIKYVALIAAFTTYITAFLIEFNAAPMDDYEKIYYLLGAGIVSIITGIKFYKDGEAKDPSEILEFTDAFYEVFIEPELPERPTAKSTILDIFKSLIKDLIPTILSNLGSQLGFDTENVDESFGIMDFINEAKAIQDEFEAWKFVFKGLEFTSMTPLCYLDSYGRDLKIFMGLSVAIGAIQILIAILILFNL